MYELLHAHKKALLLSCVFKFHLIHSSFYMFPISFAAFFGFSLYVTDGCHQRYNMIQISHSAQRNSCNTQAHFLYSPPFFVLDTFS